MSENAAIKADLFGLPKVVKGEPASGPAKGHNFGVKIGERPDDFAAVDHAANLVTRGSGGASLYRVDSVPPLSSVKRKNAPLLPRAARLLCAKVARRSQNVTA